MSSGLGVSHGGGMLSGGHPPYRKLSYHVQLCDTNNHYVCGIHQGSSQFHDQMTLKIATFPIGAWGLEDLISHYRTNFIRSEGLLRYIR